MSNISSLVEDGDNLSDFSVLHKSDDLDIKPIEGLSEHSSKISGLEIGPLIQKDTSLLQADSLASIWSVPDLSDGDRAYILPNDASPLIFDGKVVVYNISRGVQYDTPFLLGSRKVSGAKGEVGYQASHLIFDPKTGSLATGYEMNNEWSKLARFSLISGLGNSVELDSSFVSGSYNKIGPGSTPAATSCSVIGGSNNIVSSSTESAIIACQNVLLKNCGTTVVLGMKNNPNIPENLSESTVCRNLFGLGYIWAGPIDRDRTPSSSVKLVSNGDALVHGNLQVSGNIDAKTVTTNNIFSQDAVIQNLTVSSGVSIPIRSAYFEGKEEASTYVIHPSDNFSIVYLNPTKGPITIFLGEGVDRIFPENQAITFKDTTIEYGTVTSYNITILAPHADPSLSEVKIEHYEGASLVASSSSGYSLNTSGGSVTFQFARTSIPGSSPTWVIRDQFIGNGRPTGLKFIPADDKARMRILGHK